jgi:molecular chaperone GrpE
LAVLLKKDICSKNRIMTENVENINDINDKLDINTNEAPDVTEGVTDNAETSELQKLEGELMDSKDKYLRLAAEFDNFRKRTAKERLELFQTAGKDVIIDLLEVMDDSDRALAQLEKLDDADKALKEGIVLIVSKLKTILQSKGLKEMEALGTEFDPELHDAIAEIPAPDKKLKGKIVDVVTKGYYLNDKIIRHAKVVVGK